MIRHNVYIMTDNIDLDIMMRKIKDIDIITDLL